MARGCSAESFCSYSWRASSARLEAHGPGGARARDEAEQYLRYVLDSFPQFERLVIAKTSGESLIDVGEGQVLPAALLASSTPATQTSSVNDVKRVGDKFLQVASAPMRDQKGRSIGRLYALIDIDHLLPTLQSHELGQTANVFLVDRDMRFLNPPDGLDPNIRYSMPESGADGLTKLHNHRYFQESVVKGCKRSVRSKDPLSLILIDIDHFKMWNDRLGHAGGDEILRRLSEVLNECVRETDILTRYGGEEFALLALDTDLAGAVVLAEKIRQSVCEENFVTDVPSEKEQLTVSVGVSYFHQDHKQFFVDADAALYAAKDAGRNQVRVADLPGN
jgi:diguanylate cyclase (GGDEF)-like protein